MRNFHDKMREKFMDVIFPLGLDGPTLRAIPAMFRAGASVCRVGPSCIRGEDGLFATANLPVGMTWLMGGAVQFGARKGMRWLECGCDVDPGPDIVKAFHGHPMPLDDNGLIGWKANEPVDGKDPNAVFLSSPEGLYLTICREVRASPESPEEIFVYYGPNYPREDYKITRYDDDGTNFDLDEEAENAAIKALESVRGLKDRKYHEQEKPRN